MLLKTMLVGCGAVAQRLYRKPLTQLQRQGILAVTALVDPCHSNRDSLRSFFPRAVGYDDIGLALTAERPDLTLVLSPIHLHATHSILALRSKSHVLCEKPAAVNESQCLDMLSAAEQENRLLAVGMIRRFFPAFAEMKRLIVQEELGEILSFAYREGRVFDWDVTTGASFTKNAGGGSGILFDIGSHALDLLIWLFGLPTVLSYQDDALAGVEGNVFMELEAGGCAGLVQLSWDVPLRNELRINGSRAEAVLRLDHFDRLGFRVGSEFRDLPIGASYSVDLCETGGAFLSPRSYEQSMYCQLIQVVRAIRLGESPAVDAQAALESVRVIDAARRRARPLDIPWLDPSEQEAAHAAHWTTTKWQLQS